jgi:hypothetical protein
MIEKVLSQFFLFSLHKQVYALLQTQTEQTVKISDPKNTAGSAEVKMKNSVFNFRSWMLWKESKVATHGNA